MENRTNLIEKLQKKENFTSAESSLADYILNNIDNVYRMSLQDLAKASYVSKPSVIRLYRKVGCSNYREFSIALQLEKIHLDDNDPIINNKFFMDSDSLYEFVQKIGVMSKQIVDNCIASIDANQIEDIVKTLHEAKNIYLYSSPEIENEMGFFIDRMTQIDRKPVRIKDQKDLDSLTASMDEKDAVLIVTAGKKNVDLELLEKICKAKAISILVSTVDDLKGLIDPDHSFYTYPGGNELVRNSAIVSQMSLLLGLNIIQTCLIKVRFEEKTH